jgi:hypothetical protein
MGELTGIAASALEVAIVVAIPLALIELASVALQRLAPPGFFKIPALVGPSKLLGISGGLLLLYGRFGPEYFDLHRLFLPDSPWNISLTRFLGERVDPFYYLAPTHLAEHDAGVLQWTGGTGALLVLVAAASFLVWPPPAALRGAATVVIVAALSAYVTIYAVCVLMWSLFLLNFWSFAVLAIVFQYYRNRH